MENQSQNDYESFGKNAAKLREKNDLSQAQMSEKLGIPQSTYAGYETGKRKVPIYIIKKISDLFEVSIDYLLTGKHDPFGSSTIAAHHDNVKWTEEELKYIQLTKKMLLEKRTL